MNYDKKTNKEVVKKAKLETTPGLDLDEAIFFGNKFYSTNM